MERLQFELYTTRGQLIQNLSNSREWGSGEHVLEVKELNIPNGTVVISVVSISNNCSEVSFVIHCGIHAIRVIGHNSTLLKTCHFGGTHALMMVISSGTMLLSERFFHSF